MARYKVYNFGEKPEWYNEDLNEDSEYLFDMVEKKIVCSLGESEDRNFHRDLKPVLDLLNKDMKNSYTLEWEKNPSQEMMTWDEAVEYAKRLGDGLRLPTIKELEQVYEYGLSGFNKDSYWSSSISDDTPDCAWVIYFGSGYTGYSSKTNSLYVRCVREI
jgi:formylglycine-generating enzyme required for sulfatase activity